MLNHFNLQEGNDYQWSDLQDRLSAKTKDMYPSLNDFEMAIGNCSSGQPDYHACLCEHSRYWAERYGEENDLDINCDSYDLSYWYHPDYLGNTEFVTDADGAPFQYFWYSAWGEAIESQHSNQGSFSSRYRFNAKEWDGETGNYYYGARYYDPKVSVWLSVDPKAYAFPHLSPYNFMMNNPINVIDPGGDSAWTVNVETGERNYVDDRGGAEQQIVSYINNDGHDLGTKVIDGGDFHHGKIDGGYLASGTNLWNSDGSVNFGAIAQNEGMTNSLLSSGKRSLDFKLDLMSASIGEAQADFLRTGAEVSAYALQQTGDGAALAGYGLTLTGVGAPIGIPLAGLGTGMSVAGGGIQAGLHFMDGKNGAGARTLLFTAGSAGATALPGKGLGYEILRQNLGLKVSGANRLIGD